MQDIKIIHNLLGGFSFKKKKNLALLAEIRKQNKADSLPFFLEEILNGTGFVCDLKEDGSLNAYSVGLTEFINAFHSEYGTLKTYSFLKKNKILQQTITKKSLSAFKEALNIIIEMDKTLSRKGKKRHLFLDIFLDNRALLLKLFVERQKMPPCLHLDENKRFFMNRHKIIPLFTQVLEGIQRYKEQRGFSLKAFNYLIKKAKSNSCIRSAVQQEDVLSLLAETGGLLCCYENKDKFKRMQNFIREVCGIEKEHFFLIKTKEYLTFLQKKGEKIISPCPIHSLVKCQNNEIRFMISFDKISPCPRANLLLEKMRGRER